MRRGIHSLLYFSVSLNFFLNIVMKIITLKKYESRAFPEEGMAQYMETLKLGKLGTRKERTV